MLKSDLTSWAKTEYCNLFLRDIEEEEEILYDYGIDNLPWMKKVQFVMVSILHSTVPNHLENIYYVFHSILETLQTSRPSKSDPLMFLVNPSQDPDTSG